MRKFTALQKMIGLLGAFALVFMFVSFPAMKVQKDQSTQMEIKVPDYKVTAIRAAGVALGTSILIAVFNQTTQTNSKTKSRSKNKNRRNRR